MELSYIMLNFTDGWTFWRRWWQTPPPPLPGQRRCYNVDTVRRSRCFKVFHQINTGVCIVCANDWSIEIITNLSNFVVWFRFVCSNDGGMSKMHFFQTLKTTQIHHLDIWAPLRSHIGHIPSIRTEDIAVLTREIILYVMLKELNRKKMLHINKSINATRRQ